jgi:hypothetical protein
MAEGVAGDDAADRSDAVERSSTSTDFILDSDKKVVDAYLLLTLLLSF